MGAPEVEAKLLVVSGLTEFGLGVPPSRWPPVLRGLARNRGGMTGEAPDPRLRAIAAPRFV